MSSEYTPDVAPRTSRRARACKPCRAAKVRCSGGQPCQRCGRRGDACVYIADEDYVSVPRRYLRELQHQLSERQNPPPSRFNARPETQVRSPSPRGQIMTRPLESGVESVSLPGPSSTVPDISVYSTRVTQAQQPATRIPRPASNNTAASSNTLVGEGELAIPILSPEADRGQTQGHTQTSAQTSRPRNSLVGKDFAYVQDDHSSRFLFLGPTSTWTFCRRAFTLLENADNSPDTPLAPLNLDGTAFRLQWQPKSQVDASDLNRLPPMDHALFLYNTVKFRLGELFCLIDEESFLDTFKIFHRSPLEVAKEHVLWFVEYLLILAFGKAFTTSYGGCSRPEDGPNGSYLASRALSILPNIAFLQEERPALLAIRVLSLAALYFHAVDMRSPAYQYIGQAFRLSLHDGLHRRMPDDVGPKMISLFSKTWWGIYVLDQEISANLGCPSTLSQDYITTPRPDILSSDGTEKALTLRARLSRLVLIITTCNYSFEHDSVSDFVRNTTTVLHSLAELSRDIDQVISLYKTNGGEPLQMFCNIRLSYHHCIVLATRPLILWFIMRNLRSEHDEHFLMTGPGATLLEASAQSATTMILTLDDLAQAETLEPFLPFHLEYTFSAAILLSILSTFLPSYVPQFDWHQAVVRIFKTLVKKGSVAAELRQSELEHLETLLDPHKTQTSVVGKAHSQMQYGNVQGSNAPASQSRCASRVHTPRPGCNMHEQTFLGGAEADSGWWDFDMSNLSADEILALAQEFERNDPNSWLLFDNSI